MDEKTIHKAAGNILESIKEMDLDLYEKIAALESAASTLRAVLNAETFQAAIVHLVDFRG